MIGAEQVNCCFHWINIRTVEVICRVGNGMILEMLCFKGTVQLNLEVFMTLMNTKAYSKNSPCLQNVEFQPGNGQKSKQMDGFQFVNATELKK